MRIALLALLTAGGLSARVNFVRDVKPILENHCVRCHGDDRAARGVRLDRRERALMSVVRKRPDDSVLYTVVKAGVMPPGERKLSPAEAETLRRWIAEGAKWPGGVELVGKNPFVKP